MLAWGLIIAAIASYFVLMDVAWIRSTAGPVWVALALAVGIAAYCWPRDGRVRTRVGAGSIFLFALFALWAFFVAARLPESRAPAIGQAVPNAEFVAPDGTPFVVSEVAKSGPVLLVFYRGHW